MGCPNCTYDTSKIFVAFAGSVCGVMVLHGIIKLIKKFCTQNANHTNDVSENGDQPGLKNEGLPSSVIISLPAVQFKKLKESEEDQQRTECAICLGVFGEGEWMRLLPNCTHAFHVVCVDVWLRTSSLCPLCRTNVLKLEINS